jgi:hypothetical protein
VGRGIAFDFTAQINGDRYIPVRERQRNGRRWGRTKSGQIWGFGSFRQDEIMCRITASTSVDSGKGAKTGEDNR